LYTGYTIIQPDDEKLALLYEGKNTDYNFLINQYVIIQDAEGKVIDKRRWDGEKLVPLSYTKIKDFKPMTPKQECLCDMLSNPNLSIRIIAGVAGSGKSKIVMTHGLHYVFKQVYNKFFLVRHNVSVGEKNGYLPGNKFDKIRGWLGFFEDNLDSVQYTIEELFERGMLDVDSPEYLKGRDLKNSWILVDECEDLTEDQFKMIGERISAGSVMCFVGDYEQTTQEKYKKFNGLKRAIENLKGLPQVGIIVFDDVKNDNVRSEASKIFTTYY
jgi:predicted ribonuclease YlaK